MEIQVRDGVMQVGSDTYTLRNITHIAQRKLVADTGAAWRKFIVRTLLTLFVGAILIAIMGNFWIVALVAVLALLVWQLVSVLQLPPVYGLIIGTSGVEREAVWGTRKGEIDQLARDVTKAVGVPDVPPMTFHIQSIGRSEVINQYGAGSIAKATHTGSGNIGAR
ncbi:DUF6232 family protein [Nonomuraea insulae]|uniref:DUF6232 family protein n=1 Tax=Nonomuraea insulae TaxID=1616787 RepID=A0ABW1CQV3_9ACTN